MDHPPVNIRQHSTEHIRQFIKALWLTKLRVVESALDDDGHFFLLGGDSLLMGEVLQQINNTFDTNLSLVNISSFTTIERTCEAVSKAVAARTFNFSDKRAQGEGTHSSLVQQSSFNEKGNNSNTFPASVNQCGLWYLEQFAGNDAGLYNCGMEVAILGRVNNASLSKAWLEVLARHEVLRGVLRLNTVTHKLQVVIQSVPESSQIEVIDCCQRGALDYNNLKREFFELPFDLGLGPLFRVRLLRLNETKSFLCLCMHHAITDGSSGHILINELFNFYRSNLASDKNKLNVTDSGSKVDQSFRLHCQSERKQLNSHKARIDLEFWKRKLAGINSSKRSVFEEKAPYRVAHKPLVIPQELFGRIKMFSAEHDVSLFAIMLTAYKYALVELNSISGEIIAFPESNRRGNFLENISGAIGYFANLVMCTANTELDREWLARVKEIQQNCYEALEHQSLPYPELVKRLNPVRKANGNVWFDSMFVFQNIPRPGKRYGDLELEYKIIRNTLSQYPLVFEVQPTSGRMECNITYAFNFVSKSLVEDLGQRLVNILEEIVCQTAGLLSGVERL